MNTLDRILLSRKIIQNIQETRLVIDHGLTYTKVQLETIISIALLEGDWTMIEWATLRLGRSLTMDEKEIFFESRLATCSYGLARHAAQVTGIPLTKSQIDDLVVAGILLDCNVTQALDLHEDALISGTALEPLIDACVKVGLPETAVFFAEAVNRSLTANELATAKANETKRLNVL